ncbi:MAG: aminoacyl-tRNA hydrolase [Patescibacteria group bacterium]|nr:aminoacyl-tRNA hydrolase [Patescibacteria group bacterium]
MILIVGLGNPGEKYEETRHNVGFMVVDSLLKKLTSVSESRWEENKKFNTQIAKIEPKKFPLKKKEEEEETIILAKPLSFMNASGEVVAKLMNFYHIPVLGLYLVCDDVDLPLGKIKIAVDRGSAGHKGVESVMEKIGSKNFVRIRIGVGKDQRISTDKFILAPFMFWEKNKLSQAVKKAVEAVETILQEGVEKAENRYNQ